jgi:hypothetical protein
MSMNDFDNGNWADCILEAFNLSGPEKKIEFDGHVHVASLIENIHKEGLKLDI